MTGVFLIIILAVVWYVAGIFHSFALMLYVAVKSSANSRYVYINSYI